MEESGEQCTVVFALKRLLLFGSLGYDRRRLRFCIVPFWVPGSYFPPVDNIAIFRKYFHYYLREVHFGACAVQAVDWRAEHGDVTRALSLSKIRALTTSASVKRCGLLSAFRNLRIFRPRLGLHRQSCSSVFHCLIFLKQFYRSKVWKQKKN